MLPCGKVRGGHVYQQEQELEKSKRITCMYNLFLEFYTYYINFFGIV